MELIVNSNFEPEGITDLTVLSSARLRRAAIRIAAQRGLSYDEGVVMRDQFLRHAVRQTFGGSDGEEELVWKNLVPGNQGNIYE